VTVELIQPHAHSWTYPEDAGQVSDKMNLVRMQHIAVAVHDLKAACARFEELFGLKCQDFRDGSSERLWCDARILLGNECWLHLVQDWNPTSRTYQFLKKRGEGLEHIALETGDIEADVQYLRDNEIPIHPDTILDVFNGYETFVPADQTPGMTVQLIQPHATGWGHPAE
jgi:4-hydroxyphenylpyruvate dioxygenase-like putative hemolysin